jgi:hypothetical protein
MRFDSIFFVIPAKAGIQGDRTSLTLGPRFRGDDAVFFGRG